MARNWREVSATRHKTTKTWARESRGGSLLSRSAAEGIGGEDSISLIVDPEADETSSMSASKQR